jgi:hypothetical protein
MTARGFDVSPAGLMGLTHLVNVLGGQALQSHQLLLTEKTIALLSKRLRPQSLTAMNETPTKRDDLVSNKAWSEGFSRLCPSAQNSALE